MFFMVSLKCSMQPPLRESNVVQGDARSPKGHVTEAEFHT